MTAEAPLKGACHCGAVAYEATLSLEGVIECNCSHCYSKGFQLAFVTPDKFELKQGEDALSPEYLFNTHKIRHRFCTKCGVEAFASGEDSVDMRSVFSWTYRTLHPDADRYGPGARR